MLWFVCLFNYADRQAIFSVFPLLRSEMHLNAIQLGIVGSAFMWVYALAGPIAGAVGDRLPRKMLILGGLALWSLITVATALSTRYWHLVVFRSLEGLGEAFYFPASMSLISDYHGPATRSRAMAFHQSSVYAGTILGGYASGFLAQIHGWRYGFVVFGLCGILLACVLVLFLREPPRQNLLDGKRDLAEDFIPGLSDFFSNRWAVLLAGIFVGANFVAVVFLTWMPSFLHDKFNMSLSAAGLNATAWLQIASVIGVVVGGVLADRLARRLVAGRRMTQAVGLLLGFPFIALTGWTLSVPVLVTAMACFGFFKGMYDANLWAGLYDVVPAHRRAISVGIMNSLGWLGGGAAPIIIGAASMHFDMSACISATSLIYFLLGLVLLIALKSSGGAARPEHLE